MAGRTELGPFLIGESTFSISTDPGTAALLGAACRDLCVTEASNVDHRIDWFTSDDGWPSVVVDGVSRDRPGGPWQTPAAVVFSQINPLVVEAHERWRIFHGGSVAVDKGVLTLFGTSGSGKSTLTAALTASGAPYLTDEATLIEPVRDIVHPYPKPMTLSRHSLDLLGLGAPAELGIEEVSVTAGDLGGSAARSPLPLWALCHVSAVRGEDTRLERLGPVDALIALLPSFMCFDPTRDRLAELTTLVGRHPVLQIHAADLDDAVRLLNEPGDIDEPVPMIPERFLEPGPDLSNPERRSSRHLGPFSRPSRVTDITGQCFSDEGVVMDSTTGEYLRISAGAFHCLASLDGTHSLRNIAQDEGLEPDTVIEFVASLADRGWIHGYPRTVPLPVHPHGPSDA